MSVTSSPASGSVIVNPSPDRPGRLRPVPVSAVTFRDGFWAERRRVNRDVSIPHMFEQLETTGVIDNFRSISGRSPAASRGPVYRDSDLYKWMEAAAWELACAPNEGLEERLESVIDEIAAAQDASGYINTYFVAEHLGERWTNLKDWHELYCAGHLIQAAVAHHRATGRSSLLDVAVRFADHIDRTFGPGRRGAASGHPEIEMALVELYRTTRERRYLDLATFLVDSRGHPEKYGGGQEYHLDHRPVRDLDVISGHAVRALYLMAGVTDLHAETGEDDMLEAVHRLWDDTTLRKSYITGGLGARWHGEAFGDAYELPNARAYAETCAAIAGAMWAWRLLLLEGDARYADFMETALYNGFLSGLSWDGKEYFYQNPLASDSRHRRRPWFGCACCPPNIARTLSSLGGYLCSVSKEGLWVHLYDACRIDAQLPSGMAVGVDIETGYPRDLSPVLTIGTPGRYTLFLRIPAWSRRTTVAVNGRPAPGRARAGTYMKLRREWAVGDSVRAEFDGTPVMLQAHPRVGEDTGRVALRRGPQVYCFEEVDQPGIPLDDVELDAEPEIALEPREDLFGGFTALTVAAHVRDLGAWDGRLYRPAVRSRRKYSRACRLVGIPYRLWANREPGAMRVWIPWARLG
jgi:DUF1680 family protein